MKIGIVNDLALAVEALRRVVDSIDDCTVHWVAYNGQQAVKLAASDPVDLVLMDLIMPVLDGVEATRQIMQRAPCAIVIVTASVAGNLERVYDAMGHGAIDAVDTPVLTGAGAVSDADPLIRKIRNVMRLLGKDFASGTFHGLQPQPRREPTGAMPVLVALGASTGGPPAIAQILGQLPADLDAAVVIAQHVDVQFAKGFCTWLSQRCAIPVREAVHGEMPKRGEVLVAATNDHLVLASDRCLYYTDRPRDYPYRPSVDALFLSLATHWPRRGVAALLTGMGKDGARGLKALREAGWYTLAQDEATSIIYGMPKAAAEADAAIRILPLYAIADVINQQVERQGVA